MFFVCFYFSVHIFTYWIYLAIFSTQKCFLKDPLRQTLNRTGKSPVSTTRLASTNGKENRMRVRWRERNLLWGMGVQKRPKVEDRAKTLKKILKWFNLHPCTGNIKGILSQLTIAIIKTNTFQLLIRLSHYHHFSQLMA